MSGSNSISRVFNFRGVLFVCGVAAYSPASRSRLVSATPAEWRTSQFPRFQLLYPTATVKPRIMDLGAQPPSEFGRSKMFMLIKMLAICLVRPDSSVSAEVVSLVQVFPKGRRVEYDRLVF